MKSYIIMTMWLLLAGCLAHRMITHFAQIAGAHDSMDDDIQLFSGPAKTFAAGSGIGFSTNIKDTGDAQLAGFMCQFACVPHILSTYDKSSDRIIYFRSNCSDSNVVISGAYDTLIRSDFGYGQFFFLSKHQPY